MSPIGSSWLSLSKKLPEYHHTADDGLVNLIDLRPGRYINTVARAVFVKSREKEDDLGKRPYIFGLAEDSTFRVPFVCYKPHQIFFGDSVFKFEGAYVHELDDHSLLLILTEHSRIRFLPEETTEDYFWHPRIREIRRPLGRADVTLEGLISKVYNSSGLVKRCEKCARIITEDSCPHCRDNLWFWSVRVSCRLNDETGSINTVLSQYLTCKLLNRPISEILCMATIPPRIEPRDLGIEVFRVRPPEQLVINESTVIDLLFFRQCKKLIVPDKTRSRIYSPIDVKVLSKQILDVNPRTLRYSNDEDKTLYGRILAKALDLKIRRRTRLPRLHGIYLVEQPVPLYDAESAKLYLGFEIDVHPSQDNIEVGFCPTSLIRESVLDFVKWRRGRGASVESIKKALLTFKKNVILAPNGTTGAILDLKFQEAGGFYVPTFDVPLPQFWKIAHDIEVEPSEKPLLVVKPYNLDAELTYPPSCVFLDEQSLFLRSSIRRFIGYKRSRLTNHVCDMAQDIVGDVKIGEWQVEAVGNTDHQANAKRKILNDIREKLLGKTVRATGSVVQIGEALYFLPKTIDGVQ